MTALVLVGCRPEPIGSYLKALGVLRLVAEQVDSSATGWWEGDTFRLDSSLDANGLMTFMLEAYRPTPVLSPWNKDSGFKESGSTATNTLLALEASDDSRFAAYQEAIAIVRRARGEQRWEELTKEQQVSVLRNRLPDDALDWLDAAIVLRDEKPAFPALLGAGGNFGRLELSPTFMARLLQVLDPNTKGVARSDAWLRASLFNAGSPPLRNDPIGQFDPGAAGGVRADAVGGGKAITNPWDLVLVIEGALIWASGVSRRLGGGTSMASIPFTVAPSSVGQASLSPGETAKAELWAPLWSEPLGLPSLRRLFAEGRISWSARQARSGLDATRAIFTLGVDSGVSEFVRHLVAERMGQSPLAIPIGRFAVPAGPRPGVALLASLDKWVEGLRRAAGARTAPASVVRLAHRVERAMFAATSGKAVDLQALLIAVADAEAMAGRTERGRTDGPVPPVAWLPAEDWLPALDDGSVELRLAAVLALARDDVVHDLDRSSGLVRSLVRPIITAATRADRFGRVSWSREGAPIGGLGVRPISEVLADVLIARSEAQRLDQTAQLIDRRGVEPWFPVSFAARSDDAEALAAGMVDFRRLANLLSALLLLGPVTSRVEHAWKVPTMSRLVVVPAWRILAPFYSRHPIVWSGRSVRLRPDMGWARRMRSGDVGEVIRAALVRWEQAGFAPIYARRSAAVVGERADGPQLAAALLCGATRADVRHATAAVSSRDPESSLQGELS